jgi:hypothetical protein
MGGQHHALVALIWKKTWPQLYRRLGETQGRSGEAQKTSPPPGFDHRTDQPTASHYTYCASPAHYVFQDTPQKRNTLYISPLFHSKRLPCLLQYPVYFFGPRKWIKQFVANAAIPNPPYSLAAWACAIEQWLRERRRRVLWSVAKSFKNWKAGSSTKIQSYKEYLPNNVIWISNVFKLWIINASDYKVSDFNATQRR